MIKKIFISGPMTGIEKYNFPKFDKTEKLLSRYYGYKVVNPAKIARKYKVKDVLEHREVFDKMVNEELDALRKCTAIYLLKGWEKSDGVKRELAMALALNLEIILEK